MNDFEAVQQVINRYTDGCNRQDWEKVLATFTEDGVWEAGGSAFTGRAAIGAAMPEFIKQMDYFVQTTSASVISVSGGTANATTTIREGGKFAGRDEGLEILGRYNDRIVRTVEGWQFAHRKFTVYGMHRFPLLPGPALG